MNQVDSVYKYAALTRATLLDDNQIIEGWKALDIPEVRAAFEAQRAERRAKNQAALIALFKS